ncbi:hypothetical protein MVES_003113 [Malassezia vespertilionis]|uniref:triacylglycerol lipase n=1 Tax=Malassezia vespertilionis TaxID=2020962 RepID=A0A2N1J8D2_9BASI|nr:hypothetical protein MVES_003113 [Malassezia vespertilionis]
MLGALFFTRFSVLWLFVTVCVSALSVQTGAEPSDDVFFQPSGDWQKAKHGDVLRSRPVNVTFTNQEKGIHLKGAYQILFRTSQSAFDDGHAVTTVLVPDHDEKNSLIVTAPSTRTNGQCDSDKSVTHNSLGNALDELFYMRYLEAGHVVAISDGSSINYMSGQHEGRTVLDATVATLRLEELSLSKNAKIAFLANNEGAQAYGWAAALKKSYAPDLNVVGWALGGTSTNLTATFLETNGSPFSGYAISSLASLSHVYPKVKSALDDVLTLEGKNALKYARQHCVADVLNKFNNENILSSKYVKGSDSNLLELPALASVLNELSLGSHGIEVPDAPVRMVHSTAAQVAPYQNALDTSKAWCKNGAHVEFVTYEDCKMDQVLTELASRDETFHFLDRRFGGKDADSKCHYHSKHFVEQAEY